MAIGIVIGLVGALAASQGDTDPAKTLNLSRPTAGYTYFDRAGASMDEHDRDLLLCLDHASTVQSVDRQMGSSDGGLIGALIGGMIADAADNGVTAASLENCMVVYGWNVVRLNERTGEALSKLPPAQVRAKLASWIGSQRAYGDVVRVWGNDAANGSINHFSLRPGHTRKGQLSVLALATGTGGRRSEAQAGSGAAPVRAKLDPKWRTRPLKPVEFGTATAGSGIVILRVKGMSMTRGNGLVFRRIGSNPDVFPSTVDHAPDQFAVMAGTIGGGKGKIAAFALPPGRWRIASDINGLMELNYCLGSPFFELKAGEVLYAGTLDLKSEKLKPDLSLEPVQEWLAGTPAAQAVKPAAYTNGSRGPCGPNSIYALEFEGAPFEPGYALGSKAAGGDGGAGGR